MGIECAAGERYVHRLVILKTLHQLVTAAHDTDRQATAHSSAETLQDGVHPTAAGHQDNATAIERLLVERSLLPGSASPHAAGAAE